MTANLSNDQRDIDHLPLVSVCVPTHNRASLLGDVLKSIDNQELDWGIRFELIVIDDGSTDATEAVVEAHNDKAVVKACYLQTADAGPGGARNSAAEHARGEWLAFFDDDQVASKRWLSELLRIADTENADCVGGPVLLRLPDDCDAVPAPTVRKLLGENPEMMGQKARWSLLDPRFRLDIPGSGNALVRKDVFEALGGFDRHRKFGEDLDFFTRLFRSGFKACPAPMAVAYHLIPKDRLEPEYLYALASKSGRNLAESDLEHGNRSRMLLIATLRCVHILIVTLPRLTFARLKRNTDQVVGANCSLRVATEYVVRSVQALFGAR